MLVVMVKMASLALEKKSQKHNLLMLFHLEAKIYKKSLLEAVILGLFLTIWCLLEMIIDIHLL
jgi:hypothetical protein